jgi:CPA2 family monovalent cation:H+ antiporter-2
LSVRLHSVVLPDQARGVGLTLEMLDLEAVGAEVTTIRRDGKASLALTPDTLLQAGDVVVLRGTADALGHGEQRLLG